MVHETSDRVISPQLQELDKLRTPLTRGERKVLEFFLTQLEERWEIYIQPFLNGLRPDFVLLHPHVGVAVFEVKDWLLARYPSKWESGADGRPVWWRKNPQGKWYKQVDPVAKARLYSTEVLELFCPRLGQQFKYTNYAPVVTTGVIFACEQRIHVNKVLAPTLEYHGINGIGERYVPVIGSDDLESGDLGRVFPEATRHYSKYMKESLAEDLRHWLIEPDHSRTQREPLVLDKRQMKLATTRTPSGFRRIKGAAGSGKSQVLAARAARLAKEGKRVLVVSFNITLVNYLGDLAARALLPERQSYRNKIEWNNFHRWCRVTCIRLGYGDRYAALFRGGDNENVLNESMAKLVREIFSADGGGYPPEYDAILVDEGQDFRLSWWEALVSACKPEGEKFLVADATQDIYDTASAWTEERMKGAGFSGDWVRLEACYRLPLDYIRYIQKFAEMFLSSAERQIPIPPQGELELAPVYMKWIQVCDDSDVELCVKAIMEMPLFGKDETASYSDVVFITERNSLGFEVIKKIGNKGIKVAHTFDEDGHEARKQKRAFFMGRERVKATTIHSFKGWEAKLLVLHVDYAKTETQLAAVYAGLTRLKKQEIGGSYITVVCSDQGLSDYGKTWAEYQVIGDC